MSFVLRVGALLCVAAGLFFFVRSQVDSPPTVAEDAAYRDWMMKKADRQARSWDEYHGIADLNTSREHDLQPYADPTLYAPGTVVIQPGETWRDEFELDLPGGSERDASSGLGSYRRDPRIHVVRNEWRDLGVKVRLEEVWVEGYLYPTWRVRQGDAEYPLESWRPAHDVRTVGGFSREEIARLKADGARFNVEDFDLDFDLRRGEGSGWRAKGQYRITLPPGLPVNQGDRACWAEITIAAGVGGEPYRFHLIHLKDRAGVALRPYRH